jgi:hypothetical protein
MSEEAQNKDMKRYREHHTRKTSSQYRDRFIEQVINICGPSYFKSKEIIPKRKIPLRNEAEQLLRSQN